jgi:hypothetical protein
MCFQHNDLHCLNVMLDHALVGHAKLFATGFGTFRVPKDLPAAVLIDYQLSSYDAWSSDGDVRWRAHSHRYSFYNGNTLYYDVWRLSTNLLLSSLTAVWASVDADLKHHLWQCAQFPGVPPEYAPAAVLHKMKITAMAGGSLLGEPDNGFKLSDEMQWCPYLLRGVLPEEALLDPCFRCFQSGHDGRGDAVYVERAQDGLPTGHLDVRFLARAVLTPYSPAKVKRVFADVLFMPCEASHAMGGKLATFASNFAGFVRSKLTSMCRHPLGARARYAYMEVESLQLATHWFYKTLARDDMDALDASAVLDACMCVLRGTYDWWDRPSTPDFVSYHEAVRAAIMRDDVRAVARRVKPAVPVHFVPQHMLEPCAEHELAVFEALVRSSVLLAMYTQPPDETKTGV